MSASSSHGLHITVGASVTNADPDMSHAIHMLKAALLYADRVKLFSVDVYTTMKIIEIRDLPLTENLVVLAQHAHRFIHDPDDLAILLHAYKKYRKLTSKKKRFLNTREQEFVHNMNHTLGHPAIRSGLNKHIDQRSLDALNRAMESGVVETHEFTLPMNDTILLDDQRRNDTMDKVVQEYFAGIAHSITDFTTFPMFDDLTGDAIRENIEAGNIAVSDAGIQRGKHSGLAGNLLERLPLLEEATIDEILEIRRELQKPLTRFRREVIGFSEEITAAPWDNEFAAEADNLFYKMVELT